MLPQISRSKPKRKSFLRLCTAAIVRDHFHHSRRRPGGRNGSRGANRPSPSSARGCRPWGNACGSLRYRADTWIIVFHQTRSCRDLRTNRAPPTLTEIAGLSIGRLRLRETCAPAPIEGQSMNKDFLENRSSDDIEAATDLVIEQGRRVREKAHRLRDETRSIMSRMAGDTPLQAGAGPAGPARTADFPAIRRLADQSGT